MGRRDFYGGAGSRHSSKGVIMKPWYRSRTLWLNIGAMLVMLLTLLVSEQAKYSDGRPLIPADAIAWITAIVLPMANMILRIATNTGIERGESKDGD